MITEQCRKAAAQARAQPGEKKFGRSRMSNGTTLLPGIDQRSPWVRRCKDLITDHIADLGGLDNVSAPERSIVRRCAVLTTELERMEALFAAAEAASPEQLDLYQRTANSLRRLLEAVGLQRRQRVIEPDLETYLASKEHAAVSQPETVLAPSDATIQPEATPSIEAEPDGGRRIRRCASEKADSTAANGAAEARLDQSEENAA